MKFMRATSLWVSLLTVLSCSPGGVGQIFLDGQPLQSSSNGTYSDDIVLDAGVHRLELRNSAKVTLSGNITGAGSLNVTVFDGGTLALAGKQQHQGTVLESGNLDLVGAGYEFGNVTISSSGGTVRRLAIPTDISSDLRAWFDASDVNSTFLDTAFFTKATAPGARVVVWKNRAVPWPNATQKLGSVFRTADMKSLAFRASAFEINDIYLFDQAGFIAVIRPKNQANQNPKAVFTSTILDGIAPISIGIGNSTAGTLITPQVVLATYNIAYGWNSLAEVQLDSDRQIILGSSIGPSGAQMQVDGVTFRARKNLSMYRLPATSALGKFQYFIARRWDRDDTYNVDISEIVVAADTSSLDGMTGYIAWHNNLQDRLPADHPYKTQPPIAVIAPKEVTVGYFCSGEKRCADYRKPLCGPLCSIGEACISNADCASWKCAIGICAAPECSPGCAVGAKCSDKSHCTSGKCESGTCVL